MNLKVTKKVTTMYSWTSKKAFTLIELLVAITIITILALWATSLDFNRLSNKQKLEIFTNSIKTNYESIRNNALEWKWIWTNLDIPKKWKMDFSTSNSWTVVTSYSIDWTSWIWASNIDMQNIYWISSIRCLETDWSIDNSLFDTETWSIEISWINIELWWDCNNDSSKILQITFWNKINEYKTLEINTLNWLVNTK